MLTHALPPGASALGVVPRSVDVSSDTSWGRWRLDDGYLVHDGAPADYDIALAQLERAEDVARWIEHLRPKRWLDEQDLRDFAAAVKAVR